MILVLSITNIFFCVPMAKSDWLEFKAGNASFDGGQNADVFKLLGLGCCVWKGSGIETTRCPTKIE